MNVKPTVALLITVFIINALVAQNRTTSEQLIASTFIGSDSYDDDYGPSMFIDNQGFVYLCGFTTSETFPCLGGFDPTYNGGKDIFIAKFTSDLSILLGSTFIGGTGDEYEATMAFDTAKEFLYIAGYTTSADFPTTPGAFDETNNGGIDAFVLKLDLNLESVVAATFFGGSGNEGQQWPKLDIVVTPNNNVCIAGLTRSSDLPVTEGVSHNCSYAGGSDAFVAVFNNNLTHLLASTYLGGSGNEWRMSDRKSTRLNSSH